VSPRHAIVVGGGPAGACTALVLARRGLHVHVVDTPGGAHPHSGGMLAPVCELDHAEPPISRAGLDAVARWVELIGSDAVRAEGSLLVAHRPEWPLLAQLADRVRRAGHADHLTALDSRGLTEREPALEGRFHRGLAVSGEGHLDPEAVIPALREALLAEGGTWTDGIATAIAPRTVTTDDGPLQADWVIDARGLASEGLSLRGVRGEYALVHCPDVDLRRPIRLMHPRYPLYVVPRSEGRVYVGATQIERGDESEPTVRSVLELLSALFSIHPAFGDAEVLTTAVGRRPATSDNLPVLWVEPGLVRLNGLFRHGWLLAPRLAVAVADLLDESPVGDDVIGFVHRAEAV
jgi:glycine oxidase